MLNIAPYLSKYVRSLHARLQHMRLPYSHTQFGVVLMVDIVGFSALTTLATEKSESGAEAIALEIGTYMGECIAIIEQYGGDVVKFLGDAVLVCFQPDLASGALDATETIHLSHREKQALIQKAIECGMQLLARQSHYRVYLTAKERSKHRASTNGDMERRARNVFGQRFFLFDSSDSDSEHKGSTSSGSSIDGMAKPDIFDAEKEYSLGLSFWDCIPFIKSRRRRHFERHASIVSDGSGSINSIDLELHIALSCGDITNVVLGDLATNTNTSSNSNANASQQQQQQHPRRASTRSIDTDLVNHRISTLSQESQSNQSSSSNNTDGRAKPLPYRGRLEYAICGPAVEALENALTTAKAGEMCITPTAFDFVKYLPHPIPYERRKRLYILKAHHGSVVVHHSAHYTPPTPSKTRAMSRSRSISTNLTRPIDLFTSKQSSSDDLDDDNQLPPAIPPLIVDPNCIEVNTAIHSPSVTVFGNPHPTATNGTKGTNGFNETNGINGTHAHDDDAIDLAPTLTNGVKNAHQHTNGHAHACSRYCNPIYLKYINRSALYRLKQSDNDSFPAQFRDVTIMFISLGKLNPSTPQGLFMTQQAVNLCIKTLVKYEGNLQQFAVDDKGATLLAVFGLPPLSHEREAVFAAKAAVELRDLYQPLFSDFAIALSTGVIFNAVLPQGCPFRRDPAIAGDAIILAVRMLKFAFAKQNVVCDFPTKQQIGTMCDFEDYGENFVKGKVKPIMIYGIRKFEISKTKRISAQSGGDKKSDFIGYKYEMNRATRFLDDWNEKHDHHLLIISGHSGVGKSFFCGALTKTMVSHDFTTCWSSSTEVEQSSKYYLVKHLLLSLFDIIDSDKVPQSTKKRTSATHQSPSMQTSSVSVHPGDSSPTSSLSSIYCTNSQGNTAAQPPVPSSPGHPHRLHTLTTYSSVTRSSYGAYSTYSPDGAGNEVAELILRCLRKCGEEDGFLPLFKMIFGSLGDTEENRYTRRLDGRGRDILLTGVITRMVKYVSERLAIVLICDDVQWADSASIKILHHIHEHCEHAMLILATRPIKDYNVTFISNFCQTGVSEEILLNGLGADDIEDIVLRTLNAGVTKVSPDILRIIQKRTNGNPLHVKNIAIMLKDFHHVTVLDGELVPSNNRFEPKDWLQNLDYKRIIKMQFDRLDPNFQEFLTIASCLDQYFTLYEVEAMAKVSNVIFSDKNDTQAILEKIEMYDVYHFLQQGSDATGGATFIPAVNGPSASSSNPMETIFAFSHITIPKSIYGMVSYETRIILHRLLAKFYEGQLTRENYPELLGKVARHYLQTDMLEKQLYYLEALADLNMRSYLLPEATSNLESMVKILNENPGVAYRFGRLHQSDIYRRLGVCFTMRTQLKMGERYLFMALECLGQGWPQTEPEFLYKFWKLKIVQYRHRRWPSDSKQPITRRHSKNDPALAATSSPMLMQPSSQGQASAGANNNGSNNGSNNNNNNNSNNKKQQTIQRVQEIMAQLSNIYFYTGKGRAFVYSCMVGLNACEALGEKGPHYTLFLARTALLCWLNDQKERSIFYITKALRHMDEKHDSGTLTICALLCFAAGKFKNAKELLYQAIQADKTLGVVTDCQSFYRSVGLVVTMLIFEGTLDHGDGEYSGMALLKQMADTARSNGDYEAEIWLGVYHVASAIVVDRIHECESFVVLLEHHVKQAADYNRIAIHGTLLCYYARRSEYDLARKHYKYLVAILPALTVTPNIFPIFGLIFATMGLYCMVEEEQVDLVILEDAKNYDRFIVGISRLNHAFQQVKFWEFTQPCLYLARALPYISTGRTVEGFMVLRHGIYEMHFIQEIRFLKAYYYSCIGKYAFLPRDRIEWTKRAKTDLEALNIPTARYLNPDPTKFYTRRATHAMNMNYDNAAPATASPFAMPVLPSSNGLADTSNDILGG